ncbi:band 7 protein AGAP004871 [Culex quinquefasciatus]|uniref:band 7 protein AGAP004871 n=1 Tax=Culex quinquefasciatus TaxID=7176 RepID=UPI0018E2E423|nr:band 7 protein AGAP004871 [Culex quinquefasciatus]
MMVPLDPMGPAVVNGGGGPGGGGGRGGGNDVPLGSGGGINTISIATVGANASLRRRADDDYRNTLMRTTTVRKYAEEDTNGEASTCGRILIFLSWVLVVLTMPFSLLVCFKVVQEYERAVIFRLGRLMQGGAKGPGIFFILPCIDAYARVDLRTRTYDVPPQEVLTKDSVTVSVDAVVYYRVSNATVSIANVENAHHSTRLLAQTTLRNTMGTRHLHEILSERMTISGSMQLSLDEATEAWGIKVERVEIKDVRLPVQLQRAMAAEAEAAREARAKVIAAEGEQKASRALREASEVIGDSPAALQLRYLQTLNTISAEKNSTIVFPLPIDILTYFMKSKETYAASHS